jgi:hypothetical protein
VPLQERRSLQHVLPPATDLRCDHLAFAQVYNRLNSLKQMAFSQFPHRLWR